MVREHGNKGSEGGTRVARKGESGPSHTTCLLPYFVGTLCFFLQIYMELIDVFSDISILNGN